MSAYAPCVVRRLQTLVKTAIGTRQVDPVACGGRRHSCRNPRTNPVEVVLLSRPQFV